MGIVIRSVKFQDDLSVVCTQMQPANWAADNDMTSYKLESLKKFLERGGILLLACEGDKIAGAALCYELPHPDGNDTLYVHELDTHPDFRRRGVATQLMAEAMKRAKQRGLSEVWLGADQDNPAANALYRKLGPSEVESSVTYSYRVQ